MPNCSSFRRMLGSTQLEQAPGEESDVPGLGLSHGAGGGIKQGSPGGVLGWCPALGLLSQHCNAAPAGAEAGEGPGLNVRGSDTHLPAAGWLHFLYRAGKNKCQVLLTQEQTCGAGLQQLREPTHRGVPLPSLPSLTRTGFWFFFFSPAGLPGAAILAQVQLPHAKA